MYLPIVVLSVYFLLIYAVSHFSARDTSNKTYFLANKRAPWYIVSLGMVSASLSGVTFVSVPGWVVNSHFSYMQMVLGFIPGYILISRKGRHYQGRCRTSIRWLVRQASLLEHRRMECSRCKRWHQAMRFVGFSYQGEEDWKHHLPGEGKQDFDRKRPGCRRFDCWTVG